MRVFTLIPSPELATTTNQPSRQAAASPFDRWQRNDSEKEIVAQVELRTTAPAFLKLNLKPIGL